MISATTAQVNLFSLDLTNADIRQEHGRNVPVELLILALPSRLPGTDPKMGKLAKKGSKTAIFPFLGDFSPFLRRGQNEFPAHFLHWQFAS